MKVIVLTGYNFYLFKFVTILPTMNGTKTFIFFWLLLTILYVMQWWILFYYFMNVPEYIPNTSIKIAGLVLLLTIIPVLYFFQRKINKERPSVNVLQLTGLSVLLAVVSEIVFQLIRQTTASIPINQKITETINAITIAGLGIGVTSFIMAFKLKHRKSIWNTVFTIAFFGLIYFIKTYTSLLQ